jgi:hypothetical protein
LTTRPRSPTSPGPTGSAVAHACPRESAESIRLDAPLNQSLLLDHQPTYDQPTYDEVANITMFAPSDSARTITASEINMTGGAVID